MIKIKSFRPKPKIDISSQSSVVSKDMSSDIPITSDLPSEGQEILVSSDSPVSYEMPDHQGAITKRLRLIPLGGVGDVTKNMYIYEYDNDIIIVDCGIGFPDEGMLGIDLVIPDHTYLKDKISKIRGVVITHGHEDHIGSLPFIWPDLKCPIYAPPLAAGFIKAKFTENKLPKDVVNTLKITDNIELGVFKINFYQVSHSVPDSTGLIIDTPVGRIIHQADFKLDWTPVSNQIADVNKLAVAGSEGVLLMLIDALGIEKHGFTLSERTIQNTFAEIEKKTKGKVVITTNSSNITRIQQAINVAYESGRKVAMVGRSMEQNFQVARDLGYLDVPPGLVINQDEIKRFSDDRLLVVIAGSQGQVGSSLSRAVNNDHRHISLKKGDAIVFSADPIPASETAFYALVDKLTKMGFDTYYSDITPNLHVSGHARAEEIKLMINLAKPKYLLPIGATFRGMKTFSDTCQDMGYGADKIMLIDDGRALDITPGRVAPGERIEVKNVYVDGLGVGDVGSVVLRDRQVMAEEGIVLVIVPLAHQDGKLSGDIDIVSRGFVFEKESEGLLEDARKVVDSLLSEHPNAGADWRYARHQIEESLEQFFYDETKRRPLILPIVVEV